MKGLYFWFGNPTAAFVNLPVWQESFLDIREQIVESVQETFNTTQLATSSFQQIFNDLTATEDPCQAQIVSMGLEHSAGFGSRVNGFIDELMVALHGGFSIGLCDHQAHQYFTKSSWAQYFRNSLPVCSDSSVCHGTDEMTSMSFALLGRALKHCMVKTGATDYLVQLRHFLLDQVFTMHPNITHTIDNTLHDLGLGTNENFIGVHIRHGDKYLEATPVPTSEYGSAVRNFTNSKQMRHKARRAASMEDAAEGLGAEYAEMDDMSWQEGLHSAPALNLEAEQVQMEDRGPEDPKALAGTSRRAASQTLEKEALYHAVQIIKEKAYSKRTHKVYVASDDPDAFGVLEKQLGDEFTLVRQPVLDDDSFADRSYGGNDALLPLLTDIVALRRSSYMIGTSTSNIGELLFFLRKGEDMVTLDGNGEWTPRKACDMMSDGEFVAEPRHRRRARGRGRYQVVSQEELKPQKKGRHMRG